MTEEQGAGYQFYKNGSMSIVDDFGEEVYLLKEQVIELDHVIGLYLPAARETRFHVFEYQLR